MAVIGGPVKQCSIKGRLFKVAADSDVKVTRGGKKTEAKPFGDGTARITAEQMVGNIAGLKVGIDPDSDDLAFLQGIADAMAFVPCTVTMVDDNVYQGKATVSDEIAYDAQDGTAEISLQAEKGFSLQ